MTLKAQLNKDIQAANEVTRIQCNTGGTTLLSLPNNVWRLIVVAPFLIMVPGFSGIGRTRGGTRLRITFALYVKKIFIS
jgi:hypothetical protein